MAPVGFPAHRALDDVVEHLQGGIDRDIHLAPDRGIGIGKRDVQASDGFGHAAIPMGTMPAVQFQGIGSSQRAAGHALPIFR